MLPKRPAADCEKSPWVSYRKLRCTNDGNHWIKCDFPGLPARGNFLKKEKEILDKWNFMLYDNRAGNKAPLMEKSRSWPSAHDWKSCKPQKGFEGSNPSFSAKNKSPSNRMGTCFSCLIKTSRSGSTARTGKLGLKRRFHERPFFGKTVTPPGRGRTSDSPFRGRSRGWGGPGPAGGLRSGEAPRPRPERRSGAFSQTAPTA